MTLPSLPRPEKKGADIKDGFLIESTPDGIKLQNFSREIVIRRTAWGETTEIPVAPLEEGSFSLLMPPTIDPQTDEILVDGEIVSFPSDLPGPDRASPDPTDMEMT